MLVVNELEQISKSVAAQRLHATLHLWQQEKHQNNYHYLYICARKLGSKTKSLWISPDENVFSKLEECFETALSEATSFEVEFLFNPQQRKIDLKHKNQWNSLRGKYAVTIDFADKVTKWAALEMIARNLSFSRVGSHHLAICSQRSENDSVIPALIYQTKQFYCDNKSSKAEQLQPEILFRGNKVVAIEEVNKGSLLRTIKGMTTWLANQVNEQGCARYKYWPSRGEQASSNNAIRQWMATICLNRTASAFNNQALQALAETNLKYTLNTTFKGDGAFNYIWMNGTAKLGSAALAALAIFESPKRQLYLKQEQALVSLINELSNDDGSFDTFYIPRERKDNQNFYSGEALLYLATRFQVTRSDKELNRFMSGFQYYRNWHFANRNPAFVPWHTQACFLVWQITKAPELKDFIFKMNDWLLGIQQWDTADYADMQGRFYDPKRSFFGPPHASSTGVYLEGLIDAYQLAKECQDSQRSENYRIAILRGIRSIMQLQFKNEVDCYYVRNTAQVLGGVRTTVYDNTIRIDNVQHALMAFLKISSRFDDEDYNHVNQLIHKDSILTSNCLVSPEVSSANSMLWSSCSVEHFLNIKQSFNVNQWQANAVLARNITGTQQCIYFARQEFHKNLQAINNLGSLCVAIIAEKTTASLLAKHSQLPVYEVSCLLESARSMASSARKRTSAKVIAVTGSVGKTSIKDALSHVLSLQGKTHATSGNANDGWGVLETLMNLPVESDFAVFELGMLGKGSIKIKSERIKPNIGIITNIHDYHMIYHGSEESIAFTKSGLFDGISAQGTVILPADSKWFNFLNDSATKTDIGKIITFGKHPKADFRLVNLSKVGLIHYVEANILGEYIRFEIAVLAEHIAINFMAVLAGVFAAGGDVKSAISAISSIKPSFRRGEVHQIKQNSKEFSVIDDSWNANPASVAAALNNLSGVELAQGSQKILFLGDMLQLGKNEEEKHTELLELIIAAGVSKVYTVGSISKHLFQALPTELQGEHFENSKVAANHVCIKVNHGDCVLVKGSNAIEMWRIVSKLCK